MSRKAAIIALSGALIAALAMIVFLTPYALRPLSYGGQRPLIERTERMRVERFRQMRAEIPASFPIVMKIGDRMCVELRTTGRRRAGSYTVCYDRQGKPVEESVAMD